MSKGSTTPEYFFIIGAMKAGTTSLYHYLAGHPEIYASPKKEPRVFRDVGDPDEQRAAFLSLFSGRREERWCFEASTAYTKYPSKSGAPQRIHPVVPDARFVYLVRNPVDRAWSHYVHNLSEGRERLSFAHAIRKNRSYLDLSRYCMQLQQYLDVFPRERFLILVFEQMLSDPVAAVRKVSDFLGIDNMYRPENKNVAYNVSNQKLAASFSLRTLQKFGLRRTVPWRIRHWAKRGGGSLPRKEFTLTAELREHVANLLADDTEAFFEFLGRRIESWSDFPARPSVVVDS